MSKRIDLTNKRFGKLTVLSPSINRIGGELAWLCKCDCGGEKEIRGHSLRSGGSKSCGCSNARKQDMIGRRFGNWTVVEFSHSNYNH